MRRHHTKTKGDLGVIHAELDLTEKGFTILHPRTEHAPFDLVAYDGQRFYRVQVKYRAAVEGAIHLVFKSFWNDRHGTHMIRMDKSEVDVVCVYCPDTRTCYYVDPKTFGSTVILRLEPPKNGCSRGVHFARDFVAFPAL